MKKEDIPLIISLIFLYAILMLIYLPFLPYFLRNGGKE